MEARAIKYEYRPNGIVVSLALKGGESGNITEVTLYSRKDHFRGERINFGMDIPAVQEVLRRSCSLIAPTLEECTDEQMRLLSSVRIGDNARLPLEELMQLRDLERYLRATIGNYRSDYR